VRIIISINGLRLEPSDSVEFFDRCCAKACKGPEHRPFDFCYFSIFDSIHQSILRFRCMVLELLRSIFFAVVAWSSAHSWKGKSNRLQ